MIRNFVRHHGIYVFVVLTFGITWTIGASVMLAPDWSNNHLGPFSNRSPMFYLAVWAPNIAAIALSVFVTWLFFNARQSTLIAGFTPRIRPMTWINAGVLVAGAILLVRLVGLRDLSAPLTTESEPIS